jgi:hypothetical protein
MNPNLSLTNSLAKSLKSKNKKTCEVKLGYDNKSLCLAHLEGMAVDEDQKCQLSVVDITSFKNTP